MKYEKPTLRPTKAIESDSTVADVMECRYCGSEDTYEYNTDEVEFGYNGTGHYYADCHCNDCGRDFRRYINFKYTVESYS